MTGAGSSPSVTRRKLPPVAAQTLEAARYRKGLSLRAAAARAEISHSYLLDLERGRRCPSTAVAMALAEALDLSVGQRALLLRSAVPDAGYSRSQATAPVAL